MSTGYLLNIALNQGQNISASPRFCKRARFRKSTCQRCLKICPENAVTLNPGPTINNSCTACGLCQNACPTEVFQNELYTDQYVLNQATTFLDKDHTLREKKRLFIHCHKAENQVNNALLTPCLGSITENVILGALFSGFDKVILKIGICSQCSFKEGEALLWRTITISKLLMENTGLSASSLSVEEKEKKKDEVLNRRELFSKFSHQVKNKTASFLQNREKTIRENVQRTLQGKSASEDSTRPSSRRELLRKLLKQTGWEHVIALPYKPEFPWGEIRIDEKTCSACGTCCALCPTGAIRKKSDNGYQIFFFNNALCTNCALCIEACPEQAIYFDTDVAVTDIVEDKAKDIARVSLDACMLCGETIKAGNDTLCHTCHKRQAGLMYVKT